MKKRNIELDLLRVIAIILVTGLFNVGIIVLFNILKEILINNRVVTMLAKYYSDHYESLFGFLIAFCFSFYFKDIDMRKSRLLSVIANASGSIYI